LPLRVQMPKVELEPARLVGHRNLSRAFRPRQLSYALESWRRGSVGRAVGECVPEWQATGRFKTRLRAMLVLLLLAEIGVTGEEAGGRCISFAIDHDVLMSGANRRLATCVRCGRPLMDHLREPCAGNNAETKSPRPRSERAPSREIVTTHSFSPSAALVAQLVEFVRSNMSAAETKQFLRLIASKKGLSVWPDPRKPWKSVGTFATGHMSQGELKLYLNELKRRREAGIPLVRPARRRQNDRFAGT
jgi:hypothetical protein